MTALPTHITVADIRKAIDGLSDSAPLCIQYGDAELTVRITVEGGVVQHVELPPGIRAVLKDYDVEGTPEDELNGHDENGDYYAESVWENESEEAE